MAGLCLKVENESLLTFDMMGLADDIKWMKFPGTIEERMKERLPADPAFILDYYRNCNKPPINNRPCSQLFTL